MDIPKGHRQFDRFRGYVFFESDDVSLLPWNTTKDGVDEDSALYQATRLRMRTKMRPVIDMLNKIHRENQQSDDNQLEVIVEQASPTIIYDLKPQATFAWPNKEVSRPAPTKKRIAYLRPAEDVERVKESLKVSTNRMVGEKTFDYYYAIECAD